MSTSEHAVKVRTMTVIHGFEERAAGSTVDVTAVFKTHHAFVWRVLRHLGVAEAEREDVLQEVFVVVHRRLGDYREEDKMRAWLYAICARVARGHRKRSKRRDDGLRVLSEQAREPSQFNTFTDQHALAMAQSMLDGLPEKQRAVFVLHEIEQLSMPEIALAVDCPLQTAYARLRKARERVLAEVARFRLRGDMP